MRKLACATIILVAVFAVAQQPSKPAAAQHQHAVQSAAESPDKIWSELMEGNKRFVTGKLRSQAVVSVRAEWTTSQQPKSHGTQLLRQSSAS